MKKCLILANGKPPSKNVINYLIQKDYSVVLCADGGANYAYKLNIIPDVIIGDFDSIESNVLKFYEGRSKIIKYTRQDDTDVEKCLKFAIQKKFGEVILLGATGDRLDHSFCNLGIVLKFFKKIQVRILHQKSILGAYSGTQNFTTVKGELFSIYGFDRKTRITSDGLMYPLIGTPLPFGVKESTSNVAVKNKVKLTIRGGRVFVVRDFYTMRKNGNFQ